MDRNQNTYDPQSVPHPGEIVEEYLEHFGWSQRDLARRTALTPKTISEILNGKAPISPTTALAFEKVLQRPAHFWLNLQRQYDEADARQREHSKMEGWQDWLKNFPLKEMKKLQLIPAGGSKTADAAAVLSFLGVSSPDSWRSVWDASGAAFRQTRKFSTSIEAIAAWVRAAEVYASQLPVANFDERVLRQLVPALRLQTRQRLERALPEVQKACAAVGVAVVWLPAFPHTGISGCARWLSDKKAMIALSARYKTDDQLWFTFFHELGHILLHRKVHSFVLDNAAETLSDAVVDPQMQAFEDEANRFASETLIPPIELDAFIKHANFGNDAIHDFSEAIGIGPGIVVGRLQFLGILKGHQGNDLKQRLTLSVGD